MINISKKISSKYTFLILTLPMLDIFLNLNYLLGSEYLVAKNQLSSEAKQTYKNPILIEGDIVNV